MKKIFALSTASILAAAPAVAGPYVNVEANSGFDAGDYTGTLVEKHVGYTDALGERASWFVQAGPALELGDGVSEEYKVSGKVGAAVSLTKRVDAYGEVSFVSGDDWDISESNVGVKTGFTYSCLLYTSDAADE